jgi:hypothetical protein
MNNYSKENKSDCRVLCAKECKERERKKEEDKKKTALKFNRTKVGMYYIELS